MRRYQIEVSASNTIRKSATTRRGILLALSRCADGARCSVVDPSGREVYFGTVEQVRGNVRLDREMGKR